MIVLHTSAHGIPNVFRSRHWFRKLVWMAFVSFALCCALWQCTEMVLTYYSYPSHDKITLISSAKLKFPAITICNLNSVRLSSLNRSFAMFTSLQDSGLEMTHRRNRSHFWNSSTDFPEERIQYAAAFKKFASEFNQLSDEQKIEMGHDLEDMLIFCNFHGQECNTSFFSRFINYKFGNCYTFNSQKTTDQQGNLINMETLNITKAGFMYGLHLELFIQQIEYIRDMTHAAGIRLLIHDQSQMPFPEDEGVNIPPGAETDIGMMKVHIKRLKSPYESLCTEGEDVRNFYKDIYGAGYTREACKRTCAQQSIMENCGCRHWEFASPKELHYAKCNLSTPGIRNCVELYEFKFAHDDLNCHCPLQCTEELYELTVSGSQWPSTAFIENFSKELRDMGGQMNVIADDPTLIRDNLKVVVYFKQLNYELIEEEPSMTISEIDLISNMGGLVGLWVGFSVCTLAEFFELFIDVLLFLIRRCLRKAPPDMYRNPYLEKDLPGYISCKTTRI
ncbi:LOW QUALITY PROTEIN: amiloride-sensitive sodium channel subunit gamma-like [Rhinatrema bivittatum]|uniref:LOW QUALITY PROTEIN: amiloride-sensitive sodium channel subunit gamma-like n=1 Tax=Rhinatrema bivittatum TaxID=194408 RepID=UPI00112D06DA|nr:LOW QUALITY PROTEIN: amiloride-sensitive sodium channel subunit gamma-like [Rhinatrema bivittatum]